MTEGALNMNKRIAVVAAVCASTAMLLGGCNDGGKTTCKDFNAMNHKDQGEAVGKMLKDEKGKEAANLEITATRLSAAAFCKTAGKDSSTISDINHG
jgi:acid stress chaperone HdeA